MSLLQRHVLGWWKSTQKADRQDETLGDLQGKDTVEQKPGSWVGTAQKGALVLSNCRDSRYCVMPRLQQEREVISVLSNTVLSCQLLRSKTLERHHCKQRTQLVKRAWVRTEHVRQKEQKWSLRWALCLISVTLFSTNSFKKIPFAVYYWWQIPIKKAMSKLLPQDYSKIPEEIISGKRVLFQLMVQKGFRTSWQDECSRPYQLPSHQQTVCTSWPLLSPFTPSRPLSL